MAWRRRGVLVLYISLGVLCLGVLCLGDRKVAQASPFGPKWQPPQLVFRGAGKDAGKEGPGFLHQPGNSPSAENYTFSVILKLLTDRSVIIQKLFNAQRMRYHALQ